MPAGLGTGSAPSFDRSTDKGTELLTRQADSASGAPVARRRLGRGVPVADIDIIMSIRKADSLIVARSGLRPYRVAPS